MQREKGETYRGDDASRIESRNSKVSHDTVYTSNGRTCERGAARLRERPLRGRACCCYIAGLPLHALRACTPRVRRRCFLVSTRPFAEVEVPTLIQINV